MPARFRAFRVTATPSAAGELRQRIDRRERELETLRAGNPQPRVWRTFETKGYGTGRNVRFGDLDGDGELDMLFAQQVAKVRGDAFDQISCLTAVRLDGKILWQQGRPNPKNDLLTARMVEPDGAEETDPAKMTIVHYFQPLDLRVNRAGNSGLLSRLQNTSFIATWIWRGALLWELTMPKLLLPTCVLGMPNCTRLKALNASIRSCAFHLPPLK